MRGATVANFIDVFEGVVTVAGGVECLVASSSWAAITVLLAPAVSGAGAFRMDVSLRADSGFKFVGLWDVFCALLPNTDAVAVVAAAGVATKADEGGGFGAI